MNDHVVFDTIPLDHLKPGRCYVLELRDAPPVAGCFVDFRASRGQPISVVMLLVGGEYATVSAREIYSIKVSER